MRFLGGGNRNSEGMQRVSAASSSAGGFAEKKPGPPVGLSGIEKRSLTTGRVAFVITSATRAKLAALGHATDKVLCYYYISACGAWVSL